MSTLPAAAPDLDAFFSLSEFAFNATLAGVPLVVIFTDFYSEMLGGTVNLGSTGPHVVAKESDIPDGSQGAALQIADHVYTVREVQRSNSGLTRLAVELTAIVTTLYEDTFNRADPAPWLNATGAGSTPEIDATGVQAPQADVNANGVCIDLVALGCQEGQVYRIVTTAACLANWDGNTGRVCQANLASFRGGVDNPIVTIPEDTTAEIDHEFTFVAATMQWFNVRELTGDPFTSQGRVQGAFRIYQTVSPSEA